MFKKILASIGKGAATIDLVLDKDDYCIGETLQGTVYVKGGEVSQSINNIMVHLVMEIRDAGNVYTETIISIPVTTEFTINQKETRAIPFSHNLPMTLPISSPSVRFYLDTKLDIEMGVDKSDTDYLTILPLIGMKNIFQALEQLEFIAKSSNGKIKPSGQQFEYEPYGAYQHVVEELEFFLNPVQEGVEMFIELDVRTPMGEREVKDRLFFDANTLDHVQAVSSMIEEWINNAVEMATQGQPNGYEDSYHLHHEESQKGDMMGMVGGFVAGAVGGYVVSEMIDGLMDEEEEDEEEESDDE